VLHGYIGRKHVSKLNRGCEMFTENVKTLVLSYTHNISQSNAI